KEKELTEAISLVESIKSSTDPRVRYKDVRPITDVRHMIKTSVELYGDRPAFHVKDNPGGSYRAITYSQMNDDLNALGTALLDFGLKDKRIAILGENCYPWALSYLAAVCGVGVAVPLDRELTEREIENLLVKSKAECILFTKKFRGMMQNISKRGLTSLRLLVDMTGDSTEKGILLFDDMLRRGTNLLLEGNKDFIDAEVYNDNMCALLFTSGTTGLHKGVMLTHKNLATGIVLPPTLISITKEDIFFSILPIHHCYECTCGFLIPLYRGAAIAFCEGLKSIVKNLSEISPTVMLAVPLIIENLYKKIWQNAKKTGQETMMRRVMKINAVTKKIGIDLSHMLFKKIHELFGGKMRLIICGGAAINPNILQGIRDFGILAIQGYGLTECSPICALNPDSAAKNASAGYILPWGGGKIHDPDPETGIGEFCTKGDNIMLGYFNNPEATAEVLRDGWFHTGDLGYIDKDNYVYVTGRNKNVIITKNGKNVYPEEIEYHLSQLEEVENCMVWGKESETSDDTLIVATIQLNEDVTADLLGKDFNDSQAEEHLWKKVDQINKELAAYKNIRRIIIRRSDFDMTTGKKIKRFKEENKTS
ncbi:MAG: AMP-binding protein, partial [Oscillospiraceae bacterium]|nr:AMP-binding protein [Oscillospiraceae bacterium]